MHHFLRMSNAQRKHRLQNHDMIRKLNLKNIGLLLIPFLRPEVNKHKIQEIRITNEFFFQSLKEQRRRKTLS